MERETCTHRHRAMSPCLMLVSSPVPALSVHAARSLCDLASLSHRVLTTPLAFACKVCDCQSGQRSGRGAGKFRLETYELNVWAKKARGRVCECDDGVAATDTYPVGWWRLTHLTNCIPRLRSSWSNGNCAAELLSFGQQRTTRSVKLQVPEVTHDKHTLSCIFFWIWARPF